MGYYTYFEADLQPVEIHDNLEAEREAICAEPFPERHAENWYTGDEPITYGDLFDGHLGEMKWYDHATDLCALTAKYPGWLISLRAWGQDRDDIWAGFFYNGQYYTTSAHIIWPAFYPGYLQDPEEEELTSEQE